MHTTTSLDVCYKLSEPYTLRVVRGACLITGTTMNTDVCYTDNAIRVVVSMDGLVDRSSIDWTIRLLG